MDDDGVPLSGAGDFQHCRCSKREYREGSEKSSSFPYRSFRSKTRALKFYDILIARIPRSISLITIGKPNGKWPSFLIVSFLYRWKNSFALKEYDDAINLI